MPSVRNFVLENNLDINQITPKSNGVYLTKKDVQNFMTNERKQIPSLGKEETKSSLIGEKSMPATATNNSIEALEKREKMTPTRRAIGKAMLDSQRISPMVTLIDDVEVTNLWNHRKAYKNIALEQDTKLTFLPYIAKALTLALKEFPELNASIDETTEEVIYKHYYNIGIATDTDHGLFVPVVKNTDTKGLFEIADDISELAKKAQDSKLKANDMRNASTTITNLGSVQGSWFTPIINQPQVSILGVGIINQQPIVNAQGEIVIGRMMRLSFTFDHRIMDGATGQQILNTIKRLLAQPELLLMEG